MKPEVGEIDLMVVGRWHNHGKQFCRLTKFSHLYRIKVDSAVSAVFGTEYHNRLRIVKNFVNLD